MLNTIPDRAAPVVEWLRGDALRLPDTVTIVAALLDRLNDIGLDVYRITTGVAILHPHIRAESILCERGKPPERRFFPATPSLDQMYRNSPMRVVYTEARAVRLPIRPEPEEGEFGIIPDLRADGATDYLAVPLPFSDGSNKGVTYATKAPGGFSDEDLAVLNAVSGPLAVVVEIHTNRRAAETLLDLYVGRFAGRKVLEGAIRRGHGETIDAVISFTDLRNFTRLSNSLGEEAVIGLLNEYFGIVTRQVDAHDGEVLKFIGDAVLAIFPYQCDKSCCDASERALKAIQAAHREIEAIQVTVGETSMPMRVGTALHVGEVFYGNVGGESRLDFTVIGTTVNLASRIEALTKQVDRPILVSDAFARRSMASLDSVGSYELPGFDGYRTVYAPRPVAAATAAGAMAAPASMAG